MDLIKLLLVEDDGSLTYMVKGSLELTGCYDVFTAENGREGLALYKEIHPDIIVTDVEMPEMSGFEMVRKIRETDVHTPIIFASARKSSGAFVEGLNMGADNYIRKPYLPEELNLLITALLRRVKGAPLQHEKNELLYSFGSYQLDVHLRILTHKDTDRTTQLQLTEREVKILRMLLDKKGEMVLREEILSSLWGDCTYYTARSLDVFIAKIRKLLGKDDSILIQTIRGEGFRLLVSNAE